MSGRPRWLGLLDDHSNHDGSKRSYESDMDSRTTMNLNHARKRHAPQVPVALNVELTKQLAYEIPIL